MPPLPADSIHARACKLKCEKILTRPSLAGRVRRAAGGEKGGLRRAAQGPRRGAGAADRQGQCGPRFAGHRARHRAGKRAQPAVS